MSTLQIDQTRWFKCPPYRLIGGHVALGQGANQDQQHPQPEADNGELQGRE